MMDAIDSTPTDTIDTESVNKKVKLNSDLNNENIEKNDSEEEFDFSSSDLEDLDSVHSAVDETDNVNESSSIIPVKSFDNDDNHLIETKNDNIKIGNGDIQSIVDTVVNSDTSSLIKCSISLSNECNAQMDSISTNNLISDTVNTSLVNRHITDDKILNTTETSAATRIDVDDAYSDEDGAIVNFLGKANEINREVSERLEESETANNHLLKRLDKLKNAKSALLKDL